MRSPHRCGAPLPRLAFALITAAATAAAAGSAGCSGHDTAGDGNAAPSAARVPMLPGVRGSSPAAMAREAPALAGHFDTPEGAAPVPASDALLPPVMHTGD